MNRNLVLGVFVALLLVGVGGYYYLGKEDVIVAPEYPLKKHFKWRYKLTNNSDKTLENVIFTAQVPAKLTAFQKRESLKANQPYKSSVDGGTATFTIATLAPYQSKFIDLKSNVAFNVASQTINKDENLDRYLQPSQLVQSTNSKIVTLAAKLKSSNDTETAKAIYNWIKGNLEYSGYIKEDLGALYALEHKKGDCTEYASLMAALARANGIPTKILSGFVYQDSSVIKAEDLHNWVEVYIDGKWQIIDPQKERYMEKEHEYLVFGIKKSSDPEIPLANSSMERVTISL